MKQYVVRALDFTDAYQRRLQNCPLHLEKIRALKSTGNFIAGGAILNTEGKMIGSTIIFQFEPDAGLEKWRSDEPYIMNQVWEKIEITRLNQPIYE